MAKRILEDVFVTEGLPEETFVAPPNFDEIMIDIRQPGKPVIIEGPSGTGKTCTAKKILERLGKENEWMYLSARKGEDVALLSELAERPSPGVFIIDDFHRLPGKYQNSLSQIAKVAADETDPARNPKLVLIGINQVGAALIQFSPDVAKRCGIHRIKPATQEQTRRLIENGCEALNVSFEDLDAFHNESGGDYWLTQTLCRMACTYNAITETQPSKKQITPNFDKLRKAIVDRLEPAYYDVVKDFCRGRRFRPSNDPYFRILNFIATQTSESSVDLVELANANHEISGSINNVKGHRLDVLIQEKPRVGQYFYYNSEYHRFSIEDPAIYYFIKHLDWTKLRRDCGFRDQNAPQKLFDVALSFASENRELAKQIMVRLRELDVSVFYDEDYEAKYLGRRLGRELERIYSSDSRFVVCLLDANHLTKIWPTFERDIFIQRVSQQEVIPIFLDDTVFPGIPKDLAGIKSVIDMGAENWRQILDEKIIFKLIDRIG